MTARRTSFAPNLHALEDRIVPTLSPTDGGLTVYSTVTQTHWLADADLAATRSFGVKHINADGSMTFSQAQEWVHELNVFKNKDGTLGYLHHRNWTLPGNFTGAGFNQTTSDMGKLFYLEFGLQAGESISEINAPDFNNFQPFYYWDAQAIPPGGAQFSFGSGFQGTSKKIEAMYVIPEYSDRQPHGTKDPGAYNRVPRPPVNFPPINNTLVASPDGQIIHDQALDIYWLANANLAATNTFGIQQGLNPNPKDPTYININPDGSMNYATAVAWIGAMNAQDYLGHDNWRLPITTGGGAAYYVTGSGVGDEFQGSEMGELYYTELGAKAGGTVLLPTTATEGPFNDFQPYYYWSGTQTAAPHANGNGHGTFSFGSGFQSANINTNHMYVIPVFDGPRKVTSASGSGTGSLRSVIAAAHDGDEITFGQSLSDKTITFKKPIQIHHSLDIEGPGAGRLTISGSDVTQIFDIHPNASAVTIAGLTLTQATAPKGGAILDDGASLTLTAVTLSHDNAVSGTIGGAALGGALAILGESTNGMAVTISNSRFVNDGATGSDGGVIDVASATGAPGGAGLGGAIYLDGESSSALALTVSGTHFTSDFAAGGYGLDGRANMPYAATNAGGAQGGAVYMQANSANRPVMTFTSDTFQNNYVIGGSGGTGNAHVDSGFGGLGGYAEGGALYFRTDSALAADLTVDSGFFSNNTATGGGGGGGSSFKRERQGDGSVGGAGGYGGIGAGGGACVVFDSGAIAGTADFTNDWFQVNSAQGGMGGPGGYADVGGEGGPGWPAFGGALLIQNGNASTAVSVTVAGSVFYSNYVQAGQQGYGGFGLTRGGQGGQFAGLTGGGAISLFSNNASDSWTLDSDTLTYNQAIGGIGGIGGDANRYGGDGTLGISSAGGGVYSGMAGTLYILHGTITNNSATEAPGGGGGFGRTSSGQTALDMASNGGGLYLDSSGGGHTFATADSVISGNQADIGPDVCGTLGTI
jgi:hypothetical protein